MYRIFEQNLNNYFHLNKDGDSEKEFRLKIAQVLRGIADKELYKKWASENRDLYDEVNNLVYKIKQNTGRYHPFESFSRDLWGYDYIAEKNDRFPKKVVEEQLKLIHLLLGTQYWIDSEELH